MSPYTYGSLRIWMTTGTWEKWLQRQVHDSAQFWAQMKANDYLLSCNNSCFLALHSFFLSSQWLVLLNSFLIFVQGLSQRRKIMYLQKLFLEENRALHSKLFSETNNIYKIKNIQIHNYNSGIILFYVLLTKLFTAQYSFSRLT